jgi:putative aldouronate transport system permease protein
LRALKNSLAFNFLDLILGFPVPIILALLLNELRFERFKKVSQTVLYLPHFLSWVIIASVALSLFKPETGLVNILLRNMGAIDKGIPFLTEKWHWAVTYLLIGVWQNMGWGSIIYLAAITGISPDLYEAATIDGANRFQRMLYVTLPNMRMIIVLMMVLSLGNVLNAGFDQVFNLYSKQVYATGDILDTFIYRIGLIDAQFGVATAMGMFKSVVSTVFISVSYYCAYRFADYRIF